VALFDAKQRVKAEKAINKALELQVKGRGFAFVEVLSECPLHLKLTPEESERWVRERMVPFFPLGVKKDVPGRDWSADLHLPRFDPEELLLAVGGRSDPAPRFMDAFPQQLFGPDIALKLAGAGGDGAQTAGLLLTRAALNEGFDATHFPSYGPESRGGTSYADVHLAEEEVLSPAAPHPHVLVAMNAPSLAKFGPQVKPGGLVLYDSSVVESPPSLDPSVRVLAVPCARIAQDLGKLMVKNIVALGALQAATGILHEQTLLTAIRQALRDKCALVPLNETAFAWGARAVREAQG
jgi:2-oxoisovalerate ferredoxin oxidoreductase beta subunit